MGSSDLPAVQFATPTATDTDQAIALLRAELGARWPPEARAPSATQALAELCRHALLPAGKLLRPLLLVSAGEAAGGSAPMLLPAAVAVEYLHVASLVHDDVIDGDQTRRDRPSVVARFGTDGAIIGGDALIFGVFQALAECADHGVPPAAIVAATRALAQAGTDLCRGQVREERLAGDPAIPVESYLEMAGLKTGALFRGACQAGALLAEAEPGWLRALTQFAEHLGLAFQIRDDLLGYVSTPARTGKSASSDVANHRPTLPVLLGHRMAGTAHRTVIETALSGRWPVEVAHERLRAVLTDVGALDAAAQLATKQADAARDALTELPANAGTARLAELAAKAVPA